MIATISSEAKWKDSWKKTYGGFPGWKIDCPLELDGKTYIVDAMSHDGSIREFVGPLSTEDSSKHATLKKSGIPSMFISYGDAFVSEARRQNRDGGFRDFIRTIPYSIHEKLGFKVHFQGQIWKLWKSNVWYPEEGEGFKDLLEAFSAASGTPSMESTLRKCKSILENEALT